VGVSVTGSTLVRRQLGRRLRRLRNQAGKTIADVQAARLSSPAKLWRIESGQTAVKVADVRALCWLYGVDETITDVLTGLAAGTTGEGWWEDYGDVLPAWFTLYVELEAAAAEFQFYESELVPGLLQTEDYARAVYRASRPDLPAEAIDRQVALRLERQRKTFGRTPPPRITAVLNAAVVARPVGGASVLADQVKSLCAAGDLGHVEVRVLPWEVGAHAAMTGAFGLLYFDDPDDPAVVYTESQAGGRYLEQPAQVAEHRRVFSLIHHESIPIEEYKS
jgi:transcriptional regulator with XRE-family HTH domain